jgi:hypothetical protein
MVVILCALATIALVALRGRRRPPAHGRRACPHLGLAGDPFVHRDQPAEEHRCYVYLQRDRVDLTHQCSFCLVLQFPLLVRYALVTMRGQSQDDTRLFVYA